MRKTITKVAKTKNIIVRVTPTEKNNFQKLAEKKKLSDFIRTRLAKLFKEAFEKSEKTKLTNESLVTQQTILI